jgi:hypothetical protein
MSSVMSGTMLSLKSPPDSMRISSTSIGVALKLRIATSVIHTVPFAPVTWPTIGITYVSP